MKPGKNYIPMIDTSYWNTYDLNVLDHSKAAAAGIKVNMIRLGKGNPAVGADYGMDRRVIENYEGTVASGMKPMFYWRIFNISTEPPELQAERLRAAWETLNPVSSAPLIIDDEETEATGENPLPYWASIEWRNRFRFALEQMGFTNLGVYTRKTWWDPAVDLHWGDLPLLVAHWVPSTVRSQTPANPDLWDEFAFLNVPGGPLLPKAWAKAAVWQFSATGNGKGREFGFTSDDLDCNILDASVYEHWFGA